MEISQPGPAVSGVVVVTTPNALRLAVAAYLARFTGQSRIHRADPRTTMRYDRTRKNLDRHPNYILAAYMASGT